MRSENVAKIALNAVRLPKFEAVNGMVVENDDGKRFTARLNGDVILRMRRTLCDL